MTVMHLRTDQVHPGDNIRVDLGDLTELAASIKSLGIIQPLTVRTVDGKYEVVAGHRRLAAAKKAKVDTVPCIEADLTDVQRDQVMLVENLMRADLTPIEEARGLFRLIEHGQTPAQAAKSTGRSLETVKRRLAMLDLPEPVQEAIAAGTINVGTATQLGRAVAAKIDPAELNQFIESALDEYDVEPWEVDQAIKSVERAAAIAKMVKKLGRFGVALDGYRTTAAGESYFPLSQIIEGGLVASLAEHEALPCHRAVVSFPVNAEQPLVEHACVAAHSHRAPEPEPDDEVSDLGEKVAAAVSWEDRQKEQAKAEREAKAAELARQQKILLGWPGSNAEVRDLAVRVFIADLSADRARTVLRVLGLKADKTPSRYGSGNDFDYRAPMLRHAETPDGLRQVLVAALLDMRLGHSAPAVQRELDWMKVQVAGPDPVEVESAHAEALDVEGRHEARSAPHDFRRYIPGRMATRYGNCAACDLPEADDLHTDVDEQAGGDEPDDLARAEQDDAQATALADVDPDEEFADAPDGDE